MLLCCALVLGSSVCAIEPVRQKWDRQVLGSVQGVVADDGIVPDVFAQMTSLRALRAQAASGDLSSDKVVAESSQDAGAESDDCAGDAPFPLPPSLLPVQYSAGSFSESWKGMSEDEVDMVAQDVLEQLENRGFELISAGYLDLGATAWGCVVRGEDEALIVTMIPQTIGADRTRDNRLQVAVIRLTVPTF